LKTTTLNFAILWPTRARNRFPHLFPNFGCTFKNKPEAFKKSLKSVYKLKMKVVLVFDRGCDLIILLACVASVSGRFRRFFHLSEALFHACGKPYGKACYTGYYFATYFCAFALKFAFCVATLSFMD